MNQTAGWRFFQEDRNNYGRERTPCHNSHKRLNISYLEWI